jgi:flagellar biosynthetic protein FlhB
MHGLKNNTIEFISIIYNYFNKSNKKFLCYDLLDNISINEYDIDFQRFAAEDEGRTEEPTERRKREEREKGNVPRTNELPSAIILLGTILVLLFFSTYIVNQIFEIFHFYYSRIAYIDSFQTEDTKEILKNLFYHTGKIVFPIVFVSFLLGIVGNIVQVGFLFTLRPLEFQLQRIIPDFRRILPTRRNIVNLIKTILQITLILIITFFLIKEDLIPMLKTSDTDLRKAIYVFGIVAFKVFLITGIILLILSIIDYFYQRYEYIENLKMTVSEVKQEIKEEIGDPLIRRRQRERAMEILQNRNALKKVVEADVVITNPTHYAVALQYNYPIDNAPKVIAKGKDHIAILMRNIAKENNIPIEENPPIARELYHRVEVGEEIPEEFHRAVAIIYQKLDKIRKLIKR